jgi:hypothetical protein
VQRSFFLLARLEVHEGPMMGVGRPAELLSVRAARLGTQGSSHLLRVWRPAGAGARLEAREGAVPLRLVEELLRLLEGVGFPGRELAVTGVPDTSDVWRTVSLRIEVDGRAGAVEFTEHSSGHRGADAAAVDEIVRHLHAIAELSREDGAQR